jgi:DDE superfamily endonuclease
MKTHTTAPDYRGYRFPPEIIGHGVWLYFRFSLSFRDVEELMAQRGIALTYETVRQWCLKFGQTYANELRRRRPHCGDKWHMDEVFLTIGGKRQYLWRAVDQDGNVLDILVQSHRNKIEPRTRINLRDCERRRCGSSNQQNRRSAFFPPSVSSLGISNHGGTAYVQGNTMLFYRVDSSNGMR